MKERIEKRRDGKGTEGRRRQRKKKAKEEKRRKENRIE